MNARNIGVGGLAAGTLLFVLLFGLNGIMNQLIANDISKFGGIRPMDDPAMMLFFVYPFFVAFAEAYVFDAVHSACMDQVCKKGSPSGLSF